MSEVTSTYIPGQKLADSWTLYPEIDSYFIDPEDSTSVQVAFDGTEQRRVGQWPVGGRSHIVFRTMSLDPNPYREFRDFRRDMRGSGSPFYFVDFSSEPYYRENVGTADGTANLVIPYASLTATPSEVLDDGVALSSWTFTAEFGTGRESRITAMSPTPGNGSVMTATFTGKKRYIVRFEQDRLRRNLWAGGRTGLPRWQFDVALWVLV